VYARDVGRGTRWGLIGVAAAVACAGPLDRRDGALVIELLAVPDVVDEVGVTLHADGRVFEHRQLRPMDDRITALTAVPAGAARLDIRLFAAGTLVATRLGMPVDVEQDDTKTVSAQFDLGPEIEIRDPSEGAAHHVGDGFVPLTIRAVDPSLPTELEVVVNGEMIETLPTAIGWFAMIDPSLAGSILPAALTIDVAACAVAGARLCGDHRRVVEVHRRDWRVKLPAVAQAPATMIDDLLIIGDESGALHLLELVDGSSRVEPLALAAPMSLGPAVVGDRVAVVDGEDRLMLVSPDGTRSMWNLALGPQRATAPRAYANRIVVGAGRTVVAVDASSGARSELITSPAAIRAPVLVDAHGIVVADTAGNVTVLDAADMHVTREQLGEPVLAPPVRLDAGAIVATLDGTVAKIDAAGLVAIADLEAPVVHPPLIVGDRVVVAAGNELSWIGRGEVTTRRLPAPITGAPAPWGSDDAVIVGLASGLLIRVHPDQPPLIVSRLPGAALSPVVISGRIAVAGSRGDLVLLRPEDGI